MKVRLASEVSVLTRLKGSINIASQPKNGHHVCPHLRSLQSFLNVSVTMNDMVRSLKEEY